MAFLLGHDSGDVYTIKASNVYADMRAYHEERQKMGLAT
jgi:hypothetical protein